MIALVFLTAFGIPVQPGVDLQQLVDGETDPVVLTLAPGTYVGGLVLLGRDVTLEASPGTVRWEAVGGPLVQASGSDVHIVGVQLVATADAIVGVDSRVVLEEVVFAGTSGRALHQTGGDSVLDRVVMVGGLGANGGQLLLEGGTMAVVGSRFRDGLATEAGGSLAVLSGTLTVGSTVFVGHAASTGGALYCEGHCTIEETRFEGNEAWMDGGAIASGPTGQVFLGTGTDLFSNRAGRSGGGLLGRMEVGLEGVTFCANEADPDVGEGGGLSVPTGMLRATGVRFLHNGAGRGGGMYLGDLAGEGGELTAVNLLGNWAREGSAGLAEQGGVAISEALVGFQGGGIPLIGFEEDYLAYFANGTVSTAERFPVMTRSYTPGEACGGRNDVFDSRWYQHILYSQAPSAFNTGAFPWAVVDLDGDGVPYLWDCADGDPLNYPGNPQAGEAPGIDDCVGDLEDRDGDGVPFPEDCDDNDPGIYPGAVDNDPLADLDCDGMLEDELPELVARGCASSGGGGPRSLGVWLVLGVLGARRSGGRVNPGGPEAK